MTLLVSMVMLISPMMVLMTSSWMMLWVFLELSTMSFIMFIILYKIEPNWTMTYYLIQSMGTVVLLYSFIISQMNGNSNFMWSFFSSSLSCLALLLKLGMFPFHHWVLKLSIVMKMKPLMSLLIIQKMAPLWILMSFFVKGLLPVMLMGLMVSTMSQYASINVTMLMVFSSISHLSWILSTGMKNPMNMVLYFLLYSMILVSIIMYFDNIKMTNLFTKMPSNNHILIISVLMYSLAGMPPLMGFLPKWMIFASMVKNNNFYFLFFFIFFTTMNFYIYNRLCYNFFLMSDKTKNNKKSFSYSTSWCIVNLFLPLNLIIV